MLALQACREVLYGMDTFTRLIRHVKQAESGCWLWTAEIEKEWGYGKTEVKGRRTGAHRAMWVAVRGEIPERLTIDHLCRVRHCVNVEHMELVTIRENTLRGETIPARNARKTACLRGHAFDEANTRIRPSGKRACRACARLYDTRRRARPHSGSPQGGGQPIGEAASDMKRNALT